VENLTTSDQSIEVQLRTNGPSGYGGVTVWYEDASNWVDIYIHPAAGWIAVMEVINDTPNGTSYPYPSLKDLTWYNLRVDVDSAAGTLAVYVDGTYLFTHTVTTAHRSGLSGLNSGNAGGYFDSFGLTSMDPPDVDGDGVPDETDGCPSSILAATVVIDSCDSGVTNTIFPSGCSISDDVNYCSVNAVKRRDFVTCLGKYLEYFRKARVLTSQQSDAIKACQ
jgi:hypothetical protein